MLINVSIISTERIIDLIKKQIIQHGHIVESTFSEYDSALQEYKTKVPKLIIVDSDININGITFKKFLYESLHLDPNVQIVILSEYLEDEFKKELVSIGITSFIEKPFQPARIWEAIDDISINLTKKNIIRNYSLIESVLNSEAYDELASSKKELISNQIFSVRNQINNRRNDFNEDFSNQTTLDIELNTYNDKSSNTQTNINDSCLQSNTNVNSYISLKGNNDSITFESNEDVTNNLKKEGYLGLPIYNKKELNNNDFVDTDNIYTESISGDTNTSIKSKLKNFLSIKR